MKACNSMCINTVIGYLSNIVTNLAVSVISSLYEPVDNAFPTCSLSTYVKELRFKFCIQRLHRPAKIRYGSLYNTPLSLVSLPLECSYHNLRLGEAPSQVGASTRMPCLSSLEMASQTGSTIKSPLQANCA